jgi:hypothetical protein
MSILIFLQRIRIVLGRVNVVTLFGHRLKLPGHGMRKPV